MSIDQELLDILVCPESKEAVAMADAVLLDRLNAAIEAGSVLNRGEEAVTEAVTEGLLREDRRVLYPVREGIPIMLIDQSIDVSGV